MCDSNLGETWIGWVWIHSWCTKTSGYKGYTRNPWGQTHARYNKKDCLAVYTMDGTNPALVGWWFISPSTSINSVSLQIPIVPNCCFFPDFLSIQQPKNDRIFRWDFLGKHLPPGKLWQFLLESDRLGRFRHTSLQLSRRRLGFRGASWVFGATGMGRVSIVLEFFGWGSYKLEITSNIDKD